MSKRLELFQKKVAAGSTDPMVLYGLAMELRSLERYADSLQTFESLRAAHPEYVPQYLLCATVLEKLGREADQREWLDAGIRAAEAKRDEHALSELRAARALLG